MCNSYLMESFISMRIKWHKQKLGSILLLFSCYLFFFNLSFLGICFYVGQNFIYLFWFFFHSRVFFPCSIFLTINSWHSSLVLNVLLFIPIPYTLFLVLYSWSSLFILVSFALFLMMLYSNFLQFVSIFKVIVLWLFALCSRSSHFIPFNGTLCPLIAFL